MVPPCLSKYVNALGTWSYEHIVECNLEGVTFLVVDIKQRTTDELRKLREDKSIKCVIMLRWRGI